MYALFSGKKFLSIHFELQDAEDCQRNFLNNVDSSLASSIIEVKDLTEFHRLFWERRVSHAF